MTSDAQLGQVIAELARALQAEGTAQATLVKMAHLAVVTVPGCEHAGVSLVRGSRVVTLAADGDVPLRVDQIQYEVDQGPCLDAIRGSGVPAAGDLRTESRWPAFSTRASEETGVRSALSFRLFVAEDTLGALNLYSRSPDAFGEDSVSVGGVFASHAAVALANAVEHDRVTELQEQLDESREDGRRYAEQAVIALALQRSLLTELLAPDHLQLDAVYRPAAPGHEVGGDWYDAFALQDGSTALVVGDVTGHDMAAAAAMGAIRNVLRGIAWDRVAPPSQVVARLDAAMEGLGMDVTATLVHARIEQSDADRVQGLHHLRWTNAGHPPPLLVLADGHVEVLRRPSDLLLGVRPDSVRTDHTVLLPPGSTVLLYTDGLVERRREHLEVGIDRLVTTVQELRGSPLHDLLCGAVDRLVGATAEDDTALLGIRLYPEDRPRVRTGQHLQARAVAPPERRGARTAPRRAT